MPNEFITVEDDEAEAADAVVCLRVTDPLKFEDNLVGKCSSCGSPVQYRQSSPTVPPKICWECAAPQMERERKAGELGIMISEKTRQEVLEHLLRDLIRKVRH